MKTVVTGIVLGIVFSITLIFVNRAFASLPPTPPSQLDTVLRWQSTLSHIYNHRSTADVRLTDEFLLRRWFCS